MSATNPAQASGPMPPSEGAQVDAQGVDTGTPSTSAQGIVRVEAQGNPGDAHERGGGGGAAATATPATLARAGSGSGTGSGSGSGSGFGRAKSQGPPPTATAATAAASAASASESMEIRLRKPSYKELKIEQDKIKSAKKRLTLNAGKKSAEGRRGTAVGLANRRATRLTTVQNNEKKAGRMSLPAGRASLLKKGSSGTLLSALPARMSTAGAGGSASPAMMAAARRLQQSKPIDTASSQPPPPSAVQRSSAASSHSRPRVSRLF